MKNRHLDGKGEFLYDYKYDVLTFKVKDRDYKKSIEMQNFVIDIDTKDFVTGVRIMDISKVSGMEKVLFKNLVHGDFNASIKDNIITVRLNFVGKMRNKLFPIFQQKKNFTQQLTAQSSKPLKDSEVKVPKIIAS